MIDSVIYTESGNGHTGRVSTYDLRVTSGMMSRCRRGQTGAAEHMREGRFCSHGAENISKAA
jgi:hypothetical protein